MISSSLTPRMITESILKPGNASTAASMPASTRGSSSKRASFTKRSRCSVSRLIVRRCRPARLRSRHRRRQQHRVGRHREIANRVLARQPLDERRQIAAQQRLAARQPHLVDAEGEKLIDEPIDLLELQDVLARQPQVVLLRHAVLAAEVAAIGDRQPEIGSGRWWASRTGTIRRSYRQIKRAGGAGRRAKRRARLAIA